MSKIIKEILGNITIYNADCMDIMKDISDKYFDLAIVDSPYGINAPNMSMRTNKKRTSDGYSGESVASKLKKGRLNSGSGKLKNRILNSSNIDWDNEIPSIDYFNELFRISKNQIIFGGNYFDLPPTRGIICWDKLQPWENFSQFELAWTSFDCPASIFRYSNTGGANKEKKIHPTQKPVALYKWLLNKYAKQGDKILDTHFGSGSHGIACHDLGFQLTAAEKDEHYFNDSIKRIRQHQSQLKLIIL